MITQTETNQGDYQVPVLELGQKVISITNPAWGEGVIDIPLNRRGFVGVQWDGVGKRSGHHIDELEPAPGGDTESPVLGEEETMERLYNVEQSVTDAGGNLGLIEDFDIRENGVFYKVIWEDSRETWNVQGAIKPVRELKGTPTPKEVREVVEAKAPEPSYEVLDIIEAWDLNYSLGSVVQLVLLAGGTTKEKEIEDLKLAANLLKRRIDKLEAK